MALEQTARRMVPPTREGSRVIALGAVCCVVAVWVLLRDPDRPFFGR